MGPKMDPGSSPKWAQRGPQNGAENDPKMCPKWTKMGPKIDPDWGLKNGQTAAEFSCCVFGNLAINQTRILAQNPAQNGAQNGPRMDPK